MEFSVNSEELTGLEDFVTGATNFDLERIRKGAILLFDKPVGWTSFQLVKKVRYVSGADKVGHAGTLDPLASGLLVICTGKCTKMIDKIQDMAKVYTGIFNLGKTTPSFDLETEFDAVYPYDHVTAEDIARVTTSLSGEIDQVPPVYSAIKINGKRAYEHARKGEEVEMKSRKIMIYRLQVSGELPDLAFEVRCSKGTYIRTLAKDFGHALGSGAYLTQLKRTAIGDFRLEDAFNIEEFQQLCGITK
jgi:tRNA pseudouridine55 synthase